MPIPIASFDYTYSGLSFTFKDRSSGIVNSYSWDFGNGLTSTLQNPPAVAYATAGTYAIKLTVTNADGSSAYNASIIAKVTPALSLSILDMVRGDLPMGLVLDNIVYQNSIRKWQLYLQGAAEISDVDVFDESKWPSLVNVLISKLVVYDLILTAARGSMTSFITAAQNYNSLVNQMVENNVAVYDYLYTFPAPVSYPINVSLIIINGVSFGPSGNLANIGAFIAWLNSLGSGVFSLQGNNLSSISNSNIVTTFNYTDGNGGVNATFTQSNPRVVSTQSSVTIGSSNSQSSGNLKRLETGPAVAEWYDSSQYWSNIFKSGSGGSGLVNGGSGGGIIGEVKEDICTYSNRVKIKMPMCKNYPKSTKLPSVFSGGTTTSKGGINYQNSEDSEW